jgi:hypothetical protein
LVLRPQKLTFQLRSRFLVKVAEVFAVRETSRWAQACAIEELNDVFEELRLEWVESRDGSLYGKDKMKSAIFNPGTFSVARTHSA